MTDINEALETLREAHLLARAGEFEFSTNFNKSKKKMAKLYTTLNTIRKDLEKTEARADTMNEWAKDFKRQRDEARAQLERQEAALRAWKKSYPCPCGAWFDDLSQRPHAPGCPVDAALPPVTPKEEPCSKSESSYS